MTDWGDSAARLRFETAPFVGGDHRPFGAARAFRTICPFTESVLAEFPVCGEREVDAAVRAARAAFPGWRAVTPAQRHALLIAFADGVRAHRDQLALLDCVEMGMPIASALAQVDETVAFIRHYAALAELPHGEVVAADPGHALALSLDEPRGVIGVVSAWNYPLIIAASAIAPALAAGNCVIAKPSEIAPSSTLRLGAIAAACGLPPGVLAIVPGDGTTGALLAGHGDVDLIHFTGSSETGRLILAAAARSNGKPAVIEGSGKSPQLVFEDAAGLPVLGEAIAASAFANSGQLCVARTRLLVQQSVRDEVLARVRDATPRIFRAGDPLDERVNFGPLASARQRDRALAYRAIGAAEGAEFEPLATAGERPNRGWFVEPGLFTTAANDMRVAQEEIFGPLLTVTCFDTEEEAVALANGTRFGLAATAWTSDLGRARRLAGALAAGRVDIRASAADGPPLHALAAEPFRESGFGLLGGGAGLRVFQRRKAVQIITE